MAGYTQKGGSPDTDDGTTVTISSDAFQEISLNPGGDTAILYDGPPAEVGGQPDFIIDSLAINDSVTIASTVFGANDLGLTETKIGDTEIIFDSAGNGIGFAISNTNGGNIVESIDSAGNIIFADDNPCYRRGTAIRTPGGDVPVEFLKEGTTVSLADGTSAPIVWLGHRKVDCASHPDPASVWPVLVREGAFAEGVPARDLYLSPGHSVFMEGVLIQAEKLINGATILQIETDSVEYWHVELENHAIILAENLPAESYLDQGNRTAFINGGAFVEAHPDFKPKHWAETCAKLVFEGPEMASAKAAILARAAQLGYAITQDADLHVIADGKRIDPIDLGDSRHAFLLPAGARDISLQSRTFIPSNVNPRSGDRRWASWIARRTACNTCHRATVPPTRPRPARALRARARPAR